MPLYRVEMTRLLYVEAEDQDEAELEALQAETNDAEIDITSIREATEREARKDAWLDAMPYNTEGKQTVRDRLNEGTAHKSS